jgi:hypothetical protein
MVNHKNKYLLMSDAEHKNADGLAFADLASFPIENFTNTLKPAFYTLTYNDTQRFFDLMMTVYGSYDFYDDITLWLNGIEQISDSDTNFGRKIVLYQKTDIDQFYFENYVS